MACTHSPTEQTLGSMTNDQTHSYHQRPVGWYHDVFSRSAHAQPSSRSPTRFCQPHGLQHTQEIGLAETKVFPELMIPEVSQGVPCSGGVVADTRG